FRQGGGRKRGEQQRSEDTAVHALHGSLLAKITGWLGAGTLGSKGQGESEHTPVYSGGAMVGRAHRTVASPIAEVRIGTIPRGTPGSGGARRRPPPRRAPQAEAARRRRGAQSTGPNPREPPASSTARASRRRTASPGPPRPDSARAGIDPTGRDGCIRDRGASFRPDRQCARSIGADAHALRGTLSCP